MRPGLILAALLVACSADATRDHHGTPSSGSGGVGVNATIDAASSSATTGGSSGVAGSGGDAGAGGGGGAGGSTGAGGSATSGSGGGATACNWQPGAIGFALTYHQNAAHSFIDDSCDLWIGSPYSGAITRIPYADPNSPLTWTNLLYHHPHGLARDSVTGRMFAASAHDDGAKIWELPNVVNTAATDLGVVGLPTTPNGMRVAPPGWGMHGGKLITVFIDGTIAAIDPNTSAVTPLATTGDLLSGLVFDGLTLYVGNQTAKTILAVTPRGTVTPFATLPCPTAGLEVDPSERLFTGCAFTRELYQIALTDASVDQIAYADDTLGWYPRLLQWDGTDSLIIADGQLFWFNFIEL